jgi:antitoxin HicB
MFWMNHLLTKDVKYYMRLRYRIVITPEEDGWSARIPELPGCLGAGDTLEETLILLDDARRSWIEASLIKNLEIPEPVDYGQIQVGGT